MVDKPAWIDVAVTGPRNRFDLCYSLLEATLSPALLSPKDNFLADFGLILPDGSSPFIMLARVTVDTTSGAEVIVGLVCGCYLVLDTADRQSIGFIEYLVTAPGFRSHGHGSALLKAFEDSVQSLAIRRSEKLLCMVGEATEQLLPFKIRHGYRWPAGCTYSQPPITFDPISGQPTSPSILLTLMVKPIGECTDYMDTALLINIVRTIYVERYTTNLLSAVAQNAAQVVSEGLLQQLVISLEPNGKQTRLISPL